MSDNCVFCKIVRGELPSNKVYEDDDTLAFLDIHPVNPGHTLVIPKKHVVDIFDIDEDLWGSVMRTAKRVAHALEKALDPVGINLGMNNRAGAGQDVFHAHIHVMPRRAQDGHQLWKVTEGSSGDNKDIAEKIRSAID